MADFSRYLGKDERVLDTIDMKDETMWKKGDIATSEWKSWMTMIVTNKRIFSVNKRKLNFTEIRHEDIVTTGWEYYPGWGHAAKSILFLIASVVTAGLVPFIAKPLFDVLSALSPSLRLLHIQVGILCIAFFFLLLCLIEAAVYFAYKRTTLILSARDGKEYRFLLRGTSRKIDDFRIAIQEAKDISIEEAENRYFDKMNRVMLNQVNYQKALEQHEREMLARGEKVNYIPGRDGPALDGRPVYRVGASEPEMIDAPGERKAINAPGEKKAINAPGEKKAIGAPGDQKVIDAETRLPDDD